MRFCPSATVQKQSPNCNTRARSLSYTKMCPWAILDDRSSKARETNANASAANVFSSKACQTIEICCLLGKGGLARVLLVQTDVMMMKDGRELNVALNFVFRPALEDAQSLRAEAEIKDCCSRGFNNIAKVLGWLESDSGLTGFLLPVCGPPLQPAAATMDVAAFTRTLRALSGAILHIHSTGLVHVYTKPPNLLSPHLSDLGMWRLAAADWIGCSPVSMLHWSSRGLNNA